MPSRHTKPNVKTTSFQGMITGSPKMHKFFEQLKRAASTDAAVLIRGESGTGKELAARAIHNLSKRREHSFHAVNCAMLTPELVTSELFGHAKGAFTGASSHHKGFFEASHRGSLFLDEIAELSLGVQSRLLRAVQEKSFTPLGSTKAKNVDVRLISATHKALRREVALGNFRQDLMYRIRVIPIFLPRLAERGPDIELLIWRFIEEFNKRGARKIKFIADNARNALLDYSWPGNIRELHNNMEYAYVMGDGEALTLDELTPELRGENPPVHESGVTDYKDEERRQLVDALNAAKGNKGKAADALGINRSTLWRKLKEFGIS